MGSSIELNDTLKLTPKEGFPILLFEDIKEPIKLEDIANKEFEFHKEGARAYHHAPTRCFLVQNIDGKWLYWGHAVITSQTISGETRETQETSGKFKITKIYDPEYQKQVTINESPKGKSYF